MATRYRVCPVFDISLDPADPVPYDEDGWLGLPGRTVLGEFTESFIAPLGWWSRLDYERQWLEAAARLLATSASTAFVLEPARLWWTAWAIGDQVMVRQQLIVAPVQANAWRDSPRRVPYELVGDRTVDELERPPSEWQVTLDDIRDFMSRRVP